MSKQVDYSKLSDREIDVLVAERVIGGWVEFRDYVRTYPRHYDGKIHDSGRPSWQCLLYYSTDRNACHGALGKLSLDDQNGVVFKLRSLLYGEGFQYIALQRRLLLATPRQICECMLLALGKESA